MIEFIVNYALVLWHLKWIIGCAVLALVALLIFADDGRTFDRPNQPTDSVTEPATKEQP